jgi:hypothetical protein
LPSIEHDGVLADEVDAADVAVEVDAHARPVEPRRDLLDVRRLAGAVIAGDHDAAVVGKARQDRERGLAVEHVVVVEVGHVLAGLRIGRDFERALESEHLAHRHLEVGQAGRFSVRAQVHGRYLQFAWGRRSGPAISGIARCIVLAMKRSASKARPDQQKPVSLRRP